MELAYSFSNMYSFTEAIEKASKNTQQNGQSVLLKKKIQKGLDLLIFNVSCDEDIKWLQFSDDENSGIAICFWQFDIYIRKTDQSHGYSLIKRPEGMHIIPSSKNIDFETKKNSVLRGVILLINKEFIETNNLLNTSFAELNQHILSLNIRVVPFIKQFFKIPNEDSTHLIYKVIMLIEHIKNDESLITTYQKAKEKSEEERQIEYVVKLLSSDVNSIQFDSEVIARMANMDYERLKKVFKQLKGININTYWRMIRMEKAYKDLQLGLKKNEIAKRLGYKGRTNQFTYMFKKFYGYAPE